MRSSRFMSTMLVLTLITLMLSATSFAAEKRKVVYFYNFGGLDDPWEPLFMEFISEFEQEHPEIDVEPVRGGAVGSQNVYDRLTVAIASGTVPDVVHFERARVIEWAARGLLEPLDEFSEMVRSEFIPGAVQEVEYRGHVYGIPWGTDIRGLYWHKDSFSAAGYNPEVGPASIDELDSMAARLTVQDGEGNFTKIGFVPWLGNWYARGWLWTFGGAIYDPETLMPTVNTPKHVRAFEWIEEYAQRYPAGLEAAARRGKSATSFYDGVLAMYPSWNGHAALIETNNPDLEYGVGEVPHPPDGFNGTWMGGLSHVIFKGGSNPDDARTFLNWITRKEAEVAVYRRTNTLPTRRSALLEIRDEMSPTDLKLIDQSTVAWGRPPLSGAFLQRVHRTALPQVTNLEVSPKSALDEAQRLLEADFAELFGPER